MKGEGQLYCKASEKFSSVVFFQSIVQLLNNLRRRLTTRVNIVIIFYILLAGNMVRGRKIRKMTKKLPMFDQFQNVILEAQTKQFGRRSDGW